MHTTKQAQPALTKSARQFRPLRSVKTTVRPHQRLAPARILAIRKARSGTTVHVWTDGKRICFTVPQVLQDKPWQPNELVALLIDADGIAIIEAWTELRPAVPLQVVSAPASADRATVLAGIDPPATPAVQAVIQALPAAARVGASASQVFDLCMAEIRHTLGHDTAVQAAGTAQQFGEDLQKADPYRQGQRASRLSYRRTDASWQAILGRLQVGLRFARRRCTQGSPGVEAPRVKAKISRLPDARRCARSFAYAGHAHLTLRRGNRPGGGQFKHARASGPEFEAGVQCEMEVSISEH